MGNEDMKQCPYCAEMIKAEAVKCRYCGSALHGKDITPEQHISRGYWRRIRDGKRVAGVCTGLARELNAPTLILPLRLFFIITTVFYGFGLIVYIILWLLMPAPVDSLGESGTSTFPEDISKNELAESNYHKQVKPLDALLGFLLLAVGVVIMIAAVGKAGFWGFPFHSHSGFTGLMPFSRTVSVTWVPGLFTVLIFLGLFLIFLGALKFFRIVLGCGLVAVGSVFLILSIPFLPRFFLFPGLLLVGMILIIIGGLKIAFGSTKVVKQDIAAEKESGLNIQ